MRIGYARVSTSDQNLNLQQDALRAAGCERLLTDIVSGAKVARPGLTEALTDADRAIRWWSGNSIAWAAPCRTW